MNSPLLKTQKDYNRENKKRILTKAFIRMAERLDLTNQQLSNIIGPSESTLSRIFNKNPNSYLDPNSKEGELAILLIRLYRSLDALFGGNTKQCRLWLNSENNHLKDKPINLIQSIEGLILTIEYLDAMRG